MSKGIKLRKEEYTALGDFVKTSFDRDLAAISARFTKMNQVFRDGFVAKLEEVKTLESTLMLTEEQKNITKSLYDEVDLVNKELNFLSAYCKDANLNSGIITDLKKELTRGNVEGAILQIEGVKQFIITHAAALIAEGMAADYATVLGGHKESLEYKNALQNSVMNARKTLTEANEIQYKELYDFISKIMRYGKLVFNNSSIKDEYTISKVVGKMRAARN